MQRASVICSLLALGAQPVFAQAVVEPRSGVSFQSTRQFDGQRFALTGAAMRRKWGFKVYAIAAYAEENGARRAFSQPGEARKLFVDGEFRKAGVIHFLRDVSAGQVRDELADGLADSLSKKANPFERAAAERFLALFDRGFKKDEQLTLLSYGDGRFVLDLAGTRKEISPDPRLLRAVLGIWLGEKAVSSDVRDGLMSHAGAIAMAGLH